MELGHQGGSVGNQLDQAALLEPCRRLDVAKSAQDLPVQQLPGGQQLYCFQLVWSKRSQSKLQKVVEFPIRVQRAAELPAVFGVNQDPIFPTCAQQAAQQQQVSTAPPV